MVCLRCSFVHWCQPLHGLLDHAAFVLALLPSLQPLLALEDAS